MLGLCPDSTTPEGFIYFWQHVQGSHCYGGGIVDGVGTVGKFIKLCMISAGMHSLTIFIKLCMISVSMHSLTKMALC